MDAERMETLSEVEALRMARNLWGAPLAVHRGEREYTWQDAVERLLMQVKKFERLLDPEVAKAIQAECPEAWEEISVRLGQLVDRLRLFQMYGRIGRTRCDYCDRSDGAHDFGCPARFD